MLLPFPFELKTISDQGVFTGFASTYGNIDEGNDMVLAGAFTKTLQLRGSTRVLLWSHRLDDPIGTATLADSEKGLEVNGSLDLDIQSGRDAFSRLKKRIVRGLSFGYNVLDHEMRGAVRALKQIDVLEVSLTALPMNAAAVVTSVKSISSIRTYETWLHEQGFSKREAAALAAVGYKGLQTAEDPAEGELLAWLREQNAS